MFTKFLDFFKSEEDQDPSFVRLLRNTLIFFLVSNLITILLSPTGLIGDINATSTSILIAFFVTISISLYFVYRNNLTIAKIIMPLLIIVISIALPILEGGLQSPIIFIFPIVSAFSAILFGRRSFYIVTPVIILGVVIISYLDLNGEITHSSPTLSSVVFLVIFLVILSLILHLLTLRLSEKVDKARASEEIQKAKVVELNELQAVLEDRVRERTLAFQNLNTINTKRARQFQAITEVTKIITTLQNLETLLPRITEVISHQFENYHTGIFLLDTRKEFAILRAANSAGGKKMLERGHKLQIGQTGIVGYVTATGQPRIALDVGADSVFFNNPDLPNTRSEIALPLRYGGEIIGALDVQSTEPDAFNQEDISVLLTLADQVAIAINNARSNEETQKALSEAQVAIRTSTLETWQVLKPKKLGLGLSLKESSVVPLDKPIEGSHIQNALELGQTSISNENNKQSDIAIPIRLRGQIVGTLNISTPSQNQLSEDEVEIVESVAERLSLAIESATLLQAAQYRADFERVTSDITTRIGASTRFETILQTAATELSRALGGSDVLVQIEPVALEMSVGNE